MEYQDNNGKYQLASKKQSCAGVALVAMIEGGSNGFADAPLIKIYAEPKQVEAYARTLQRAILDFNKRVTQFDLQAKKAMEQALSDQRFSPGSGLMVGVTGFQTATELWSIEDWKRQSNIPNAMRSLLVRKIDSSLPKYHKADLESDFANKYKYLIQVMDNVMKHRAQKPDSKRSFAMNRLGMQA
ncbi:MAG: hypothetical protein JKY14_04700 [Paraglaciecola sp.]|nr:hypothetical protein [Paraglaciecola sp.]